MGGNTGNVIVDGNIDTEKIYQTHQQIREIVSSYKNVNLNVNEITRKVKNNWVGEGRKEFETQYSLLIRKIDDFGEVLQDIYDSLVDAEAGYESADNELKQAFREALEEVR